MWHGRIHGVSFGPTNFVYVTNWPRKSVTWRRKALQRNSVWGWVLFCWNMAPEIPVSNGKTWSRRISSTLSGYSMFPRTTMREEQLAIRDGSSNHNVFSRGCMPLYSSFDNVTLTKCLPHAHTVIICTQAKVRFIAKHDTTQSFKLLFLCTAAIEDANFQMLIVEHLTVVAIRFAFDRHLDAFFFGRRRD